MKILLVLFCCLATLSLPAQQFEMGINAGIGFNTAPTIDYKRTWQYYDDIRASGISSVVTLEVLRVRKKWQYGIEAGLSKLSCKYYYVGFPNPYPYPLVNATIANPAIPVKAVVNRQVSFGKLKAYAGVSAGYVFAKTSNEYLYDNTTVCTGNGWLAGAQAGATCMVSKRTGINAKLQANYMLLTINGAGYALWYIPFTVGIRYRI